MLWGGTARLLNQTSNSLRDVRRGVDGHIKGFGREGIEARAGVKGADENVRGVSSAKSYQMTFYALTLTEDITEVHRQPWFDMLGRLPMSPRRTALGQMW